MNLKVLFNSDKITVSPYFSVQYIDGFYDTQMLQDSSGLVTYFPINLDQEHILDGGIILNYEPFKSWQFNFQASTSEFKQRGVYEEVDFGNSFQTWSTEFSVRGKLP